MTIYILAIANDITHKERRHLGYYSTAAKAEAELREFIEQFPESIIKEETEDREGYKYRHTVITEYSEYCVREVKVE